MRDRMEMVYCICSIVLCIVLQIRHCRENDVAAPPVGCLFAGVSVWLTPHKIKAGQMQKRLAISKRAPERRRARRAQFVQHCEVLRGARRRRFN